MDKVGERLAVGGWQLVVKTTPKSVSCLSGTGQRPKDRWIVYCRVCGAEMMLVQVGQERVWTCPRCANHRPA